MDIEEKYLYHYTSIETLVSILKNKTIRFRSLLYVDDLEECQTEDFGNFGRFVYTSCWTYGEEESIPLWNMYSIGMKGVRIKLPTYPFQKYQYKRGEFIFLQDTESFINYKKLFHDSKAMVHSNSPKLIKVIYTEDRELLYPQIYTYQELEKRENVAANKVGIYKRKCWEFQRECRYILLFFPVSIKDIINDGSKIQLIVEKKSSYDQMPTIPYDESDRMFNNKTKIPYDYFDLNICQEFIDNIEVTTGPKTTAEEKEIVRLITKEYTNNATVKESTLLIQ